MNILDKKNAEGYSDPTPYQAARNMIHPGEVWTFNKKDDTEAEVLIVAYNNEVATILYLMDECKDGCVDVFGSKPRFVNPRMLNWAWGSYLGKCVRKLDFQEFAEITVEIEMVLSVKIQREAVVTVNPNEVDKLKNELLALESKLADMDADKAFVDVCCDQLQAELNKAKSEAQKYKIQFEMLNTMYSDLTEKLLKRA